MRGKENKSRDELKKMNRMAYIKMVAIAGFVVAVIAFSSIAWFTMSREVEGTGTKMTASELPFEIAVEEPYTSNAQTDYSTFISTQLGYDIINHQTSNTYGAIKCLMVDETADPQNATRGLQPGSHGTITFHIKPKIAGTYNVHINIAATGYHTEFEVDEEDDSILPANISSITVGDESKFVFYSLTDFAAMQAEVVSELSEKVNLTSSEQADLGKAKDDSRECPKAAQFLNGHILFFENRSALPNSTDISKYYSDFIAPQIGFDRAYTFTEADVSGAANGTLSAERKDYLTVTLYWVWPNTFGQIVLDNGDRNLSERDPALFSSLQTAPEGESTPREELTTYIASHSSSFFESSNTMFSDTTNEVTGDTETAQSKISAAIAGLSTNPDNIFPLSNGYNNADQIIGENVQLLLTEIIVEIPNDTN